MVQQLTEKSLAFEEVIHSSWESSECATLRAILVTSGFFAEDPAVWRRHKVYLNQWDFLHWVQVQQAKMVRSCEMSFLWVLTLSLGQIKTDFFKNKERHFSFWICAWPKNNFPQLHTLVLQLFTESQVYCSIAEALCSLFLNWSLCFGVGG